MCSETSGLWADRRMPAASAGLRDLCEEPMKTGVLGQLRVEAGGQQSALAHSDGSSPSLSKDLDVVTENLLNDRSPDEHRRHRGIKTTDLQLLLKGVQLGAVAVAAHCDVQPLDPVEPLQTRFVGDVIGQQDQPGAGAENG